MIDNKQNIVNKKKKKEKGYLKNSHTGTPSGRNLSILAIGMIKQSLSKLANVTGSIFLVVSGIFNFPFVSNSSV